jgi:[1-hydroxy-2-(trimethylamino)ethyl]phosphonate dioxygenase
MDVLVEIETILTTRGHKQYGLHDVSQLQHALQAAWLAEQDGAEAALVAAALLHDIGHMTHNLGENPAREEIDDHHEEVGHRYLSAYFGPEVTEPVRLHVAAKRYLCAVEPDYFARLSPDSVLSLKLQGGPMGPRDVAEFRTNPYAEAAVRLRRFDEAAKVKDLNTPPPEHFLRAVAASLRAPSP